MQQPSTVREGNARFGHQRNWPTAVLLLGLVVLGALGAFFERGFTFVVDEWDILAHHHNGAYLTPYNGHLSLVPIVIYRTVASTFGLGHHWPYGLIALGIYLAIPLAFFATHRRHVDPWMLVVMCMGIAWGWAASMNVLYAFLLNFDLPIVMLIVGWWAIREGNLRGDALAVAAIGVALATSSIGVVVAVAICAELLLQRTSWKRLLRFVPPLAAWAAWWLVRHDPTHPATLSQRLHYAANLGVAIFGGFTFGWKPGAFLVAAALAILFVFSVVKWKSVDAHVVAIGIALVFFIALTAWSRAGDLVLNPPNASRYVWFGDVLILAAVAWCIRGIKVAAPLTIASAVFVLITAVALVGNLQTYRRFALGDRDRTRPYLVEAQDASTRANPNRILPLNLIPVSVGEYLSLVHHFGSPTLGVPFSQLGSPASREAADQLLIEDLSIQLQTAATPSGSFVPLRPASPIGGNRINPGTIVRIKAPSGHAVTVRLRRYATTFPANPLGRVAAGEIGFVTIPPDSGTLPFWLQALGAQSVGQATSG